MFEFNYNKYKRKTQTELNFLDKWEQLDSIFHKKKKRINFFDEFDTEDKTYNNTITNKKTNMNTNTLSIKDNFNFQKLIHPIDEEFDKYIKEKIDFLEKIKFNEYKQNKLLLNNIEEYNTNNNFNIIINKYKKNTISLIKGKNEPIFILNKNRNTDSNYKDEINKMKTQKYFFSETNENNDTDIGKRNKMRLNNLLNKFRKENLNTEIMSVPNKFDILNKDENKDHFDLLYEQINVKKNKIK